ncbi:hypothetical protein A3770_18p81140 [Chloropicon primus]|uniref:Uncharacterized protein n=2 Tax=Chloropicon primus TaxID=1764295 RepID=A0A5B8MZZ7_9CHLO|nr:hypothetical protein A3770_18p81140 [Chloropicon primus]|eukprot:QDZ25596.1 hypothetical protein A3770_18p81140 [Chloropicon primus]
MSLIFSTHIEVKSDIICAGWSKNHAASLLAVSCRDGSVRIYNKQGEESRLLGEPLIHSSKGSVAEHLSWHPDTYLLSIGWSDGSISFWNGETCCVKNDMKTMKAKISCFGWTSAGRGSQPMLFAGDLKGNISVYKSDSHFRPVPIAHFQEHGKSITDVCFSSILYSEESFDQSGIRIQQELSMNLFYYSATNTDGSQKSSVHFCSRRGDKGCILESDHQIECMVCTELPNRRMITLTSSLMLSVYEEPESVASSYKISESWPCMISMKLAGTQTAKNLSIKLKMLSAGSESMVICSNCREPYLRVIDIDTQESDLLNAPHESGSNNIVDLAFNKSTNLLLACTKEGSVIAWQYLPYMKKLIESSAEDYEAHEMIKPPDSDRTQEEEAADSVWQIEQMFTLPPGLKSLLWSSDPRSLSAMSGNSLHVLSIQDLRFSFNKRCAAIQTSSDKLTLLPSRSKKSDKRSPKRSDGNVCEISMGTQIFGFSLWNSFLLAWSNKQATIFQISTDDAPKGDSIASQKVSSFPINIPSTQMHISPPDALAIHQDCFYAINGSKVDVHDFQGNVISSISFDEIQGSPTHISISNDTLVVMTQNKYVKVCKISNQGLVQTPQKGTRESTTTKLGRKMVLDGSEIGEVRQIACNSSGTCVAVLAKDNKASNEKRFESGGPATLSAENTLIVYDTVTDKILWYDLGTSQGSKPVSVSWDLSDPRLLAVQAKQALETKGSLSKSADLDITTFFVSPNDKYSKNDFAYGIYVQERHEYNKDPRIDYRGLSMIGVCSPLIYCYSKGKKVQILEENPSSEMPKSVPHLVPLTIGCFVSTQEEVQQQQGLRLGKVEDKELSESDLKSQKAFLDLSYYLSIGNGEDAFRAIKQASACNDAPLVWEQMARMCIRADPPRLDIAEYCLSHMGHIRGARAVREAEKDGIVELDARIASVAVHLGMQSEAANLLENCSRFDLQNKLYQAGGQWEKALKVASEKDRIHMKSTMHSYARHLESLGDFDGATKAYQSCGQSTVLQEVPRMLFTADRVEDLEAYIQSTGISREQIDKGAKQGESLGEWWAKYLESQGDIEKALMIYEQMHNVLGQVRIHCYTGNFELAKNIASNADNSAGFFYLARQLEALDEVEDAIYCFKQAKRFSHAVRLAKRYSLETNSDELDSELVSLAFKSSKQVMTDIAWHFESQQKYQRAVQLYHKGGDMARALQLCFRENLFNELQQIADELIRSSLQNPSQQGDGSSKEGGGQRNKQEQELLANCGKFFMNSGQHLNAAHLLIAAGEMNEALDICVKYDIPITEEMAEAMSPKTKSAESKQLLYKLAKCCKRQGNFHLACKKYTQAGEKVKAMKALLQSGDVEKIVFYTGVSRNKEIYLMAANFLQNLDWHNNPDIMMNIITFYTKAKANDSLSTFYEACAQIEIDEYKSYEKALQALRESHRYAQKSRGMEKEMQLESLKKRMEIIERFIQARQMIADDPEYAVNVCQGLLEDASNFNDTEVGVRQGDVYSLLVEHYYAAGMLDQCAQYIHRMRSQNIPLGHYVDRKITSDVLGSFPQHQHHQPEGEDGEGGVMLEEDVDDGEGGMIDEDSVDEMIDEEIMDEPGVYQ